MYEYTEINDLQTSLVYTEFMLDGSDLEEPMNQETFEKLKDLIEEN